MHASFFRCSVGHLLYAATLTAASTALFGWMGIPIAVFVLMLWSQILAGAKREVCGQSAACPTAAVPTRQLRSGQSEIDHRRRAFSKPELIVVLLLIGLLAGLLMPAARDADPLRQAEISMKMVVRAIKQYCQQHGQFPAAVLRDEDGLPLHSWRAQILPFVEAERLAAAYDMNQAWCSPHNAALTQYRPWHFRAYYEHHALADSDTAMQLVPMGDSPVLLEHEELVSHWLEPVTFDHSRQEPLESMLRIPSLGRGHWEQGFFASRFRGRLVVSMSNTFHVHPSAKPSSIRAALMTTHDTTEPVVLGQPVSQVHWANVFHLLVFVGVVLYPLRWLHRIGTARGQA